MELYGYLLRTFAKEGDRIFDPMAGSGSSRVACHKMGFEYVGCEIDKQFYDDSVVWFNEECLGEKKVGDKILVQLEMF